VNEFQGAAIWLGNTFSEILLTVVRGAKCSFAFCGARGDRSPRPVPMRIHPGERFFVKAEKLVKTDSRRWNRLPEGNSDFTFWLYIS